MKKFVIALIGACFTLALFQSNVIAEQWVNLDEVTPPLFVDASRITKSESRVRAWVKMEAPNGFGEFRWLFEFDCANGTYRTIEAITRIGTELSTTRYDEQNLFKGIGGKSRYVTAYVFACKSALGTAAIPAEEQDTPPSQNIVAFPSRSSDPKAWVHLESVLQGTDWFLDAKSLRISKPQVLAWIKIIHPSFTLFGLYEYDCVRTLYRLHAYSEMDSPPLQFSQPGWSHPEPAVSKAFTSICEKMLTQTP